MYIRHNGSKIIAVLLNIFILILFPIVITACSSEKFTMTGDWKYDKLPNNYEVWRINSASIVIGKKDGENSIKHILQEYVLEFCYNNTFIGVKTLTYNEKLYSASEINSNIKYYLINTETDILYGPYNKNGYEEQCNAINAVDLCGWIKTTPKPEGAKY